MPEPENKKPRRALKNLPPERFQPKMLFFWLALVAAVLALLWIPNQTATSPDNISIQDVVERAVLLCRGDLIRREDVAVMERSPVAQGTDKPDLLEWVQERTGNGTGVLEQAERLLLEAALERAGGNRRQAARLLGVDRKQVERRLQKYGLNGSKLT